MNRSSGELQQVAERGSHQRRPVQGGRGGVNGGAELRASSGDEASVHVYVGERVVVGEGPIQIFHLIVGRPELTA